MTLNCEVSSNKQLSLVLSVRFQLNEGLDYPQTIPVEECDCIQTTFYMQQQHNTELNFDEI